MNPKAQSRILMDNVMFLILVAIFVMLMALFIWNQMNGTAIWAEYYAKETTKLINLGLPGDEITLDIHKATKIARDNKVKNFNDIFNFDNINNEVCIKLARGRVTCHSYFNGVNINNMGTKIGPSGNILRFNILEKPVPEEEGE